MRYEYVDLAITDDGDLVLNQPYTTSLGVTIGDSVDMQLYSRYDALEQAVRCRLTTRQTEYRLNLWLGHSLDDLIGQRLTPGLLEQGRTAIVSALTYDALVLPTDLTVVGLPFDKNTLVYHIEIANGGFAPYRFNLIYDRTNGTRRID